MTGINPYHVMQCRHFLLVNFLILFAQLNDAFWNEVAWAADLIIEYLSCRTTSPTVSTGNEHIGKQIDFWKIILWTDYIFSRQPSESKTSAIWALLPFLHYTCSMTDTEAEASWFGVAFGSMERRNQSFIESVQDTLNGERYVNEIVVPYIAPCAAAHALVFLFQQDNARPYTSNVTRAALNGNNVRVLYWPVLSTDISPIKHIWDMIKCKISNNYDSHLDPYNRKRNKRKLHVMKSVSKSWNTKKQQ
jgi:hypothetical protein